MACIIIKIGGALIDAPYGALLAADIAKLAQCGHQLLIVHGGGPQLDHAIYQENRVPQKIAGRRITSAEDLKLAARIWKGDISTQWVQLLFREGVSSLALTGQDAQLIQAQKRSKSKIYTASGVEKEVDFGFVGDIQRINVDVIKALWQAHIVPIVAPLGSSADGSLLNINADTIATSLSVALQADRLILLSNIAGLLRTHQDPKSRIPSITNIEAQKLLDDGTIRTGMRPKVESILDALHRGVTNVHLADGRVERVLSRLAMDNETIGTHFLMK